MQCEWRFLAWSSVTIKLGKQLVQLEPVLSSGSKLAVLAGANVLGWVSWGITKSKL
jgi:hypothetical protein